MKKEQQLQLNFDKARELRDQGMRAASDHADAVVPTWTERALAYVHAIAMRQRTFTMEDVRMFAHNDGLPLPPDGRAWGTVARVAAHRKWIAKQAYKEIAKDPKVHMNEVQVWRSLLLTHESDR